MRVFVLAPGSDADAGVGVDVDAECDGAPEWNERFDAPVGADGDYDSALRGEENVNGT